MTVTAQPHTHHLGYERNIRLANAEVELILPTEYGPRVMRYAPIGGDDVLGHVSPDEPAHETPYGPWHIRGGHRLWYGPENDPGSYHPDDAPVHAEIAGRRVTLVQQVEADTGLEKSIAVELAPEGSHVRLVHRLVNRGKETHRLAPWSLTVMARGGRAILPQPPYAPHPQALAPTRPIVMWPFTRMRDPRWTWGDRLIQLRHDPAARDAQKIGAYDAQGWTAYAVGKQLFVKKHTPLPGAHADFGCNVQTFTNALILELETLGPLVDLAPGDSVEHEEEWWLFDGVTLPDDEDALHAAIGSLMNQEGQQTTPG